ncbi:hypothetical protein ACFP2T_37640 [Plantactinospora solaniradicis]|uniref:Uncharacterized protein n=1 Tax=Plantactinospora solaniradicis TaxID=1723736 RepID=A0ABW1KM15_9ACTN
MSGELERRAIGFGIESRALKAVVRIGAETKVAQTYIHAKSAVGEFALSEVGYLKAIQREYEQVNPDAADAIALIVNTTIQGIARSVSQFGSEFGR